ENNMYQVLSGLNEGERVVISGQFMLDSKSRLREAIQKMLNPATMSIASSLPSPAERANASPPPIVAQTAHAPNEYICPTEYECPMPEHMNITYNHGGKCPICGMTLIPKPLEKSAAASPAPQPKPQH